MNKYIFILIGVVAIGATALLVWRSMTASIPEGQIEITPTPTVTPTPQVSISATPSGSVTPSVTSTPTPTPTVTSSSSTNFEDNLNASWVYGQSQQTVSGKVYFIDNANKKLLKRGDAANAVNAETVFTSDSGNVGSFNVIGSSIIIAVLRDASTNESKLVRHYPSSGQTSLLYKYSSNKVEIANFLIQKDTTAEFYLGLTGVDKKFQPMAMYVKQYSQVWVQTLEGSKKEDSITAMGRTQDGKTLRLKLVSTFENIINFTIPE